MSETVTLNDLLDGHVGLDIECLDRVYLNGYVPKLQVGGQVVGFMTRHLGYPIPSPAIMEKIGTRFRCLIVSNDALGLAGPVADNISGNVIGMGLATAFRFWTFRRYVFQDH